MLLKSVLAFLLHVMSVHRFGCVLCRLLLSQAGVAYEIKEPSTPLHGVTDHRLPLVSGREGKESFPFFKGLGSLLPCFYRGGHGR